MFILGASNADKKLAFSCPSIFVSFKVLFCTMLSLSFRFLSASRAPPKFYILFVLFFASRLFVKAIFSHTSLFLVVKKRERRRVECNRKSPVDCPLVDHLHTGSLMLQLEETNSSTFFRLVMSWVIILFTCRY